MNPTIEELYSDKVEDAPLLQNTRKARWEVKNERPSHRVAIEQMAKGLTDVEVSKVTGLARSTIANIRCQPQYQQHLANEIRRLNEDEEVVEIIRANVVPSVKAWAEDLKREPNSLEERKHRAQIAEKFLERRYGKCNQPINRDTGIDLDAQTIAEIAAQLPKTNGTK